MTVDMALVHRARTELFESGSIPEPLRKAVRPEILVSWRRSQAFGAAPDAHVLPFHPDSDLESKLYVAAEPVLKALAENLVGLGAGVLLADRHANIVERWVYDRSISADLDRICSNAGFGAPEDMVGTNGIGSVAETGRAHQIVGPEHYAEGLVGFACVGAPIRNRITRRVEGIVTLSLRADAANELLTPLMISTAADIENRLLESATLEERILLDAYLQANRVRNRMVAAVGADLFIAGPRVARSLEAVIGRGALWDVVSEVVGKSGPTTHRLDTADGSTLPVVCTPVLRGDRLIGVLVEFDSSPSHTTPATLSGRPRSSRRFEPAGGSREWRDVLDVADRYSQGRVSVVLTGGPGTGKWELLRQMAGGELETPAAVVVDLAAGRDVGDLADRLEQAEGTEATIVVLRHLEVLGQDAMVRVGSLLARLLASETPPWIMGTLSIDTDRLPDDVSRFVARFGGVPLGLPALRERPDDIPTIAESVLRRLGRDRSVRLSADAMNALRRSPWPGNIRQLEAVLHAVTASRNGEITAADLPADVRANGSRRRLSPIEQHEFEAIVTALRHADGNKVLAAKLVGLSRSTVYRKMRAYGIEGAAGAFRN